MRRGQRDPAIARQIDLRRVERPADLVRLAAGVLGVEAVQVDVLGGLRARRRAPAPRSGAGPVGARPGSPQRDREQIPLGVSFPPCFGSRRRGLERAPHRTHATGSTPRPDTSAFASQPQPRRQDHAEFIEDFAGGLTADRGSLRRLRREGPRGASSASGRRPSGNVMFTCAGQSRDRSEHRGVTWALSSSSDLIQTCPRVVLRLARRHLGQHRHGNRNANLRGPDHRRLRRRRSPNRSRSPPTRSRSARDGKTATENFSGTLLETDDTVGTSTTCTMSETGAAYQKQ